MGGFPNPSLPANLGPHKRRPTGTLKAAYDDLVRAAGGLARTGELLEVSKSQVGRITDPDGVNAKAHFTVAQVRALQADTIVSPAVV